MIELTINTLVGNALIELMERKNINTVSYKEVHNFGSAIVKELNRNGIRAVVNSTIETSKKFEYQYNDMFNFYEHNQERFVSYLKSSSTEQLRLYFRSLLTVDTLVAMTSKESLNTLGISENNDFIPNAISDSLKSSLDKLKERYFSTRTLDDAVLALFYSTDREYITKDPNLLHRAFEEIKNETEILLVNELVFNHNGINTWCYKLDSSFTRLEMSELLPYIIMGNESWYLLEWSREHQKQVFLQFSEEERKQIIDGAQILKRLPHK